MGKKDKERRVYPKVFKAEVAAPAGENNIPPPLCGVVDFRLGRSRGALFVLYS
jgi:hypothetical protein